jgi:hypothetical protein
LSGDEVSIGRGKEMTTGFDELLERNRQQFDGLFGGGRSRRTESGGVPPAIATSTASAASMATALDAATSPTVRALDARFDDGWQYEIMERRAEGNDVVVLCRLSIPAQGITVTSRGRAPRGSGDRIVGRVGDIPFSAGIGDASPGDADSTAWRTAADNALANCLNQIAK